MTRIGLLSDTHSFIHPKVFDFFSECDEIWHAGDIGDVRTADTLAGFKPFRAVCGNIDDTELRKRFPEHTVFLCEKLKVFMLHIGGYPGNYNSSARAIMGEEKPGLVVTGHSHILKIIYDHRLHHLHINPGAAGRFGQHKSITLVRFEVEQSQVRNPEILDIKREV